MFGGYYFTVLFFICLAHKSFADLKIISREEWHAKPVKGDLTPLETPVGRIIIAHTAGNECKSKDICMKEALNIQHFHMDFLNFEDIAYNFLIGSDGNVYEGRGTSHQGAIAKGFNVGSISIGYMGLFTKDLPSQAALDTGKALLDKLVKDQKLKEDYKLYGHRQLSSTESPGDALYAEIQKWPKWTSEISV